jgi:AcrR family transcriptional regulator
MKAARRYASPLREAQERATRERILGAMAALVAEGGLEDMSIPPLARRAGVSVRTVFRHFPTRAALVAAFNAWADGRIGVGPADVMGMELPAVARRLHQAFDGHPDLVISFIATRAGRTLRGATARDRRRVIRAGMAAAVAGLEPRLARRAYAVANLLVSSFAWLHMRDFWGLDGGESGRAAAWAVRTLIRELRRNPKSLSQEDDR